MDLQTTDEFINYIIALKNNNAAQAQQIQQLREELKETKATSKPLKNIPIPGKKNS